MTQTKHPFILNACHMERGGVLPYMDYTGMCRSTESGTGSTNQRFCLEQGILYAIPTLEHGLGDYVAARIAVQTFSVFHHEPVQVNGRFTWRG